jgi:hypothetical protein
LVIALPRLDVPNDLHRSFLSTNCIENVFKNLRRYIGKVCRWRESTDQADRWLASGLILASKGFRRIVGHNLHLPELAQALERKYRSERGKENQRKENAARASAALPAEASRTNPGQPNFDPNLKQLQTFNQTTGNPSEL